MVSTYSVEVIRVGSTDKLEEDITGLDGVNSIGVIDVRRAIG